MYSESFQPYFFFCFLFTYGMHGFLKGRQLFALVVRDDESGFSSLVIVPEYMAKKKEKKHCAAQLHIKKIRDLEHPYRLNPSAPAAVQRYEDSKSTVRIVKTLGISQETTVNTECSVASLSIHRRCGKRTIAMFTVTSIGMAAPENERQKTRHGTQTAQLRPAGHVGLLHCMFFFSE